nr:hypothetical protein CFP56_44197 [Quercus suber]
MRRPMSKPFSYFPSSPLNGEEKLLMQIEVAIQLEYLLILTVVLFFALRKCKRNGGRVQTTVRFNADGDTSGDQITSSPTSLAVNATISC